MLKKTMVNNVKSKVLKNEKGMTLIEIMIVIAIIGGLMAVLGGNVMSSFGKAKIKEAKIQMREVGKALDLYYADCGSYPNSMDALIENSEDCSDWGPDPYLKKMPKDPWNSEFAYSLDGGNYELISFGADKDEGGEGKNADISSADL